MTGAKKFFADLSIGRKLYGSFLIVIALFAVAIVVGMNSIGTVSHSVETNYSVAITAKDASAAAFNIHVSQAQNVADGGKVVQMHKDDIAAYQQAIAKLRRDIRRADERKALDNVDAAFAKWSTFDKQISDTWGRGDFKTAGHLLDGGANDAADNLSKQLDTLSALVRKNANDDAAAGKSSAQRAMIALAIFATLLALGISFLVTRVVRRGVNLALERLEQLQNDESTELAAGLDAMADGDLTRSVTPTTQAIENPPADEIGKVQHAVNGIRDRTISSVEAFNAMGEKLRGVIGEVSASADSVSSGSQQMALTSEEAGKAVGEIATAVGDVAQGAERQVRQVESVRISAGEAAAAAGTSAEQAREAAQAAEQARQVAQDGVEAAEQATEAMRSVRDNSESVTVAIRELAGKSDEIGTIVQTITGIAGQTNLLALNAAIEAARAGEQGRGFAVVAEEVRKLAEESQQAAEEISGLVEQIQAETQNVVTVVEDGAERTEQGAETVEHTRDAFVRIGGAVDDVSTRIVQIATAAEQISVETEKMQGEISEVAAVAEQSSASTEQVSASAEETSASAQEIAASAQELASTAEVLERLVSQFKVSV